MSEHRARKRFGQNFLRDERVIERIVAAINPKPGETLVEIGPGQGALTWPVLQRCHALTVIEIDRDLVPRLRAEAASRGAALEVIEADVLTVDFSALAAGRRLRVIGNLPYNISTPVLFHLLEHSAVIQDMHFMLQKEVVERMAAEPGSKAFGRLSVALQARCTVSSLFRVAPGRFWPVPQVDSAIVRLQPRHDAAVEALAPDLDRILRAAFNQRRKTLSNTLKGVLELDAIHACHIDPQRRPEQLSVEEFLALARQLRGG